MPVQVSTPHWKLLCHIFKEALEVETFFCLAPRTAPDLPIILSTRNSFIWSPYSPDGFQVPIIRSLTAPRSAGTCQAAVTGEDDQDLGKWCRHPLSQGHQRIFLRRERVFSIPEYITCAKVVIWHDFLVRPSLICDRQFLLFKYSGSMSIYKISGSP